MDDSRADAARVASQLQRRVLRGKEVELTDDELRTADLHADRLNPALRMQSLLFVLVSGAQIPLQLSQILGSTEIRWLSVFALAAFTALFGLLAVAYPRYFRNIKRFQTERAAQRTTESSTPGT